ncbi:MAG: 8-amino-7-oxononanoate synthase [Verrucomicrobia bacterium]|nr:MAG: 8-amino-7-oxononanoate synthase [Verrucomicrobiota bacterium]TAE87114.1 MAG: 8-amino-7-oxononanoate synthase [Verrucomicrobiota bacterium]TAF24918.1 MAG: 8-amino-7-oxononanoate synthase [Verrucomicrobiota bacterium]TAF40755.1 MAG: 8-amino-7-oxononanoate synthase [Verrucomicrobiota bacterium]
MPEPGEELARLAESGLLRSLRTLDSSAGPRVRREGRDLWNFASNDYLGLAAHPDLASAFIDGIRRYGSGATASRLVSGSLPPHHALEEDIALAKGSEAALCFSSGFAAATGSLPALVGKNDVLVLDKLCHACLIDGARLSGATIRVFPHNDIAKLDRLLTSIRARQSEARVIVVTESVFSMDGDLCPLARIVEAKDRHGALLFLDEAHAFGVIGPAGMGLAAELGLQSRIDFQMGTFSKAAGLSGGYLACSKDWRDLLINRARSFIYSTAPPPALAHAARTSLELIRSATGDALRQELRARIKSLSPGHPSPVIPRILGENTAALAAAERLENLGFLVPAIRYPTVPRGTARLRISLSASHPPLAVDALRDALAPLE